VQSVLHQNEAPIPFEELICSTLATLRIDQSVSTGKPLSVDAAQKAPSSNSNLTE
jgi:hypothetical protein